MIGFLALAPSVILRKAQGQNETLVELDCIDAQIMIIAQVLHLQILASLVKWPGCGISHTHFKCSGRG